MNVASSTKTTLQPNTNSCSKLSQKMKWMPMIDIVYMDTKFEQDNRNSVNKMFVNIQKYKFKLVHNGYSMQLI